ncbi:YbgC/FadM family acyl-CoA thioesterase [Pelagibacterales bacterium SAG-MED17]|nr:YbgC/FadM family acyl-CoA thioesterase [Pelagibacterales bacterium SAG-MED17]
MKKFKSSFKVYYEDTDAGGVVYYANYLKFIERARTEAISSLDFTNSNLKENHGIFIIVKSCNLNFIKPSRLEDNLDIFSEIMDVKNVSLKMKQDIFINDNLIFTADIHLATINKNGKLTKMPEKLKEQLTK